MIARPPGADQHEDSAAELVDREDNHEREEQVHHARDHDIEHDPTNAVSGGFEHLLGVVEDHVDAAPLLEDGQEDAKADDPQEPGLDKIAEVDACNLVGGQRCFDVRQFGLGVLLFVGVGLDELDIRQRVLDRSQGRRVDDFQRRGLLPLQVEVPLAGHGPDRGRFVEQQPDLVGRRHGFDDLPIDDLRGQDADHDGQLIDRHKPAAHGGRRDFGDVHG